MAQWENVRLCNFQRRCSWVRVTAWTSLFIRYIYRLFTRNSRNTNSACLNCTGVSPHKLTPWRPSKRCNPAIRRGVLKKSPKGLVAHSDWAGPCSEKQPAAPSLDELWNRICSGKHVGRRVVSQKTLEGCCKISRRLNLSRALTFPCSCASLVSPWYG